MRIAHPYPTGTRSASYLRCYPADTWRMRAHREMLSRHAVRIGLPEPVVFIDNGCRSFDPLPRLEELVQHAAAGHFGVVLVPGSWVFSLNDEEAHRVRSRLAAHGCHVLEPPHVRSRAGNRPG
ncbi:hypothetical protein OG871_03380 [Kitasatospora sp. NBC_00374]|uniref:hypothetical protein n=1 Tax=Kitasatospora sp. NBC_00374 TaxID=2975964 RepID=UPI0032564843